MTATSMWRNLILPPFRNQLRYLTMISALEVGEDSRAFRLLSRLKERRPQANKTYYLVIYYLLHDDVSKAQETYRYLKTIQPPKIRDLSADFAPYFAFVESQTPLPTERLLKIQDPIFRRIYGKLIPELLQPVPGAPLSVTPDPGVMQSKAWDWVKIVSPVLCVIALVIVIVAAEFADAKVIVDARWIGEEKSYYEGLQMWRVFYFLPIPVAIAVFGLIYVKRHGKAALVGGILGVVSICLSAFQTLNYLQYDHDYARVSEISARIHFELPGQGTILTQSLHHTWEDTDDTEAVYSYVRFAENDYEDLASRIPLSPLWMNDIPQDVKDGLPDFIWLRSGSAQYYLTYEEASGLYNQAPSEGITSSYVYLSFYVYSQVLFIATYQL